MKEVAPNIPVEKLENLLSGVFGILSPEGVVGLGLPDFPIDNIIAAAKIMVIIILSPNGLRNSCNSTKSGRKSKPLNF